MGKLYGNIKVLGAILPSGIVINGVPNISEQDLKSLDYDLILVVDNKIAPILKKAENLNINIDKIVKAQTVCVPLFTLEKYNKLRHSQLSIISMNCWGSLVYNSLGMEFLSPTINMRTVTEEHFLKMLQNPFDNMNKELVFNRTAYDKKENIERPIFNLGETEWYMVHDDVKHLNSILTNWYKRRYRINWLNAIAVMNTNRLEILEKFSKLPFAKKVCFVPFETNTDCAFFISPELYHTDEFNNSVACLARDTSYLYDIWDILLYGKKTPLKIE